MKLALVTGSAAGFGLLTAVELARAGFEVFATMRDLGRRSALDEAAKAAGVTLRVERLDVTDQASIDECAARVHEKGPLSVLVNNAGYGLGGFVEDVSIDELKAQFETNFFGAVRVTKAFLPRMREARAGTIVNVSSVAGRMGVPGLSAYHASKWALEGWSECLRYETAPDGVHVVLVEPGAFKTEIFGRGRKMAARSQDPSSPHHEVTKRYTKYFDEQVVGSAEDPVQVARLITRIAQTGKPSLRYPIGRDARLSLALKKVLPDGLFGWLIGQHFAGVAKNG